MIMTGLGCMSRRLLILASPRVTAEFSMVGGLAFVVLAFVVLAFVVLVWLLVLEALLEEEASPGVSCDAGVDVGVGLRLLFMSDLVPFVLLTAITNEQAGQSKGSDNNFGHERQLQIY